MFRKPYVDPDGRYRYPGQAKYLLYGVYDYGKEFVEGLVSLANTLSPIPALNWFPGGAGLNIGIAIIQFDIAVIKNPAIYLQVASGLWHGLTDDIVYFFTKYIHVVFGKPTDAEVRRFGQAAVGTCITVYSAAKLYGSLAGTGKAAGAASASKKPIVIGENMKRVRQYADEIGGQAYRPWKNNPFDEALAMKRNKNWIKKMMAEGREIIDIGPDFFERRLGIRKPSKFYGLEREMVKNYNNYHKVFERLGKNIGGVLGLDL